ncbi:DUF1501 domain-containing protein [Conexibacter sp. SYSU D00693]|uniref:DUF1501 domain-containing protein n=1 Tax=Conexibacter sp. SYSU D00693 TaxID=2812560 RepID=UPI00196A9EED|nr:DUF1501 domain-containing protein [Conexibacter sp. SYSU D00693]
MALDHRCCTDFVRAGRGLPAIEAGMPTPAGTGLTRRTFVSRAVAGALAVYGASKLPIAAFDEGIAQAAGSSSGRVLLNVYLPGGIDSLSVLAPVGDPQYEAMRPTLKLAEGAGAAFTEDQRLMWAPAADALRVLHEEGKVSVLPAIGYDGPDNSHFTSRHFYEVGATDATGTTGWLGRFLDLHGSDANPLQGVALDDTLAPSLATASKPVAAVPDTGAYDLWTYGVSDPVWTAALESVNRLGGLATEDPALRDARTAALSVQKLRADLAPLKSGITPKATYPSSEFATRLKNFAAMVDLGLPIKVATAYGVGGYDTHADQARTLAPNLKATCDALLAFQRDLEARGIADRVLVQVWSEFGRRAKQNDTGTDHGAAGIGFVIGTRAKGTMVGEFPGLATLDPYGNLRATSDFRAVYCSLLEQWMGVDAAPVIPGAAAFARPALVRT